MKNPLRGFWSSLSEDATSEYDRIRRRDFWIAVLLLLAGLFIFTQPAIYGAEHEWVFDMVEHGHWSVGRVVATCDGPNRVYVVRGDTGVALTVVPNGCSQ